MINRVVFHRTRTVTAVALYFQAKINVVFFTGLQAQQQAFALLGLKIASVSIDAVFGVNQITMVLDKPLNAIGVAALFVRRKSKDKVAVGNEAFFLQAKEVCHQEGVTFLDIRGAAPIEEAIHFVELKRIHGPVLA